MANHEAVAALPVTGDVDKAALRALLTRRFAYALDTSEDAQTFVAVDPASGVVPLYLIQNSTLFAYDSTDSTTAHDGVTCLVSFDNKRFKSETIAPPYSVLTRATTAQPASPTVGDRYLIPTAATGTDWAGQDGKIGVYTAAGWRFAVSPVGRLLHVEDEESFYHRDVSGVWTPGLGSILFAAGSVNITNVLGADASFVVKVENQTTNTPPASPVAPVAYIIGSSPTGTWSGHAGKLAYCLVDGAFTIITPTTGDSIYDKSLAGAYQFTGSAWEPIFGAIKKTGFTGLTSTGNQATDGSGAYYTYSSSGAPTTANWGTYDQVQLTYTATKSGARLLFTYRANLTSGSNSYYTVGLFRDNVSAALDWVEILLDTNGRLYVDTSFEIFSPDALSHIYFIKIVKVGASNGPVLNRRLLTCMEVTI